MVHQAGSESTRSSLVQFVEEMLRIGLTLRRVDCHGPIEDGLNVGGDPIAPSMVGSGMSLKDLVDHGSRRVHVGGRSEVLATDPFRAGVRADPGRVRMAPPGSELDQLRRTFSVDHDGAR